MVHKIVNHGFVDASRLVIEPDRVKFTESGSFGARTFAYGQIVCVLMAADHRLSLQVGREVFSIATKPDDSDHQKAIAALVEGARKTLPGIVPAPT